MAIRFLDAIDLTGLEMTNVLAQNLSSNPTTPLGEGQFFYDSTAKTLKYWNGTTWVELDGQGGVTGITAGKGITVSSSTGAVTVGTDYSSATNIILSASNAAGTKIPLDSQVIYATKNTVSYGNVSDLPFTDNTGTVTGVTGTAPIASSGGAAPVISISDFTGANGTTAGTKGSVPAPAAADNVKYLKGDGTWASIPAGFAGFDISDGTNSFSVASGDTVQFTSKTLNVDASTKNTVQIGLKTIAGLTAGKYTSADVTVDAQGLVTAIAAGGAGTMSSFTIEADSGTAETISDNDSINFAGGEGIVTDVAATDTINIVLDLSELPTKTAKVDPKTDYLVGLFDKGADQNKVIINDLGLSFWGAPTQDLGMASNKITDVTNPTAAQDAATKNYVDTTFAGSGALIYQGGYDATTAAPSVGVKQGWTYAVTVAGSGNPAGFWSPTLEVGDLVIANIDTPTTAADWTEINKNIDVATATVQGIANFPTTGGLTVSSGAVSLAKPGTVAATYGAADTVAQVTVDDKGIVTSATDVTIAIGASQVKNFCAEVDSCVAAREFTQEIGGATSMDVVHNLGTQNVIVQVYEKASGETVNVGIVRKDTKTVVVTTAVATADKSLVCLISKIG
jgi:hypothetical protein